MELYSKPHKDSWKSDQEILDRDVLPRLGAMPLEEIRKSDIYDVTLPILKRRSPSAANHCFKVMRAVLNWGANEGYGEVEYSPMSGMKATPRKVMVASGYCPRKRSGPPGTGSRTAAICMT